MSNNKKLPVSIKETLKWHNKPNTVTAIFHCPFTKQKLSFSGKNKPAVRSKIIEYYQKAKEANNAAPALGAES